MKTLNVYEIGVDNPPKDGEYIVWLKKYGDIVHTKVELIWDDRNGGMLCYDGESYYEGHDLMVLFGTHVAENGDKWITEDDYWEVFR